MNAASFAIIVIILFYNYGFAVQNQNSAPNEVEQAEKSPATANSKNKIGLSGDKYPNPFWASSSVSFTLERGDSAKIELYDIMGKSLGLLSESYYEAGNHTVTLNLNKINWGIPSGLYFIRISTSDTTIVEKMTLLK